MSTILTLAIPAYNMEYMVSVIKVRVSELMVFDMCSM